MLYACTYTQLHTVSKSEEAVAGYKTLPFPCQATWSRGACFVDPYARYIDLAYHSGSSCVWICVLFVTYMSWFTCDVHFFLHPCLYWLLDSERCLIIHDDISYHWCLTSWNKHYHFHIRHFLCSLLVRFQLAYTCSWFTHILLCQLIVSPSWFRHIVQFDRISRHSSVMFAWVSKWRRMSDFMRTRWMCRWVNVHVIAWSMIAWMNARVVVLHIQVHMYAMCTRIYIYIYIYTYTSLSFSLSLSIYIYIYIYVYIREYTYVHIDLHNNDIYICTQIQ